MKTNLFNKNIDKILAIIKRKNLYSITQLREILNFVKQNKLISQAYSFELFLNQLIKQGFKKHDILMEDKILTRYSFDDALDIYTLILSFKKNSFFSMSTALNIQGFSNYRNDFIFLSCELSKKEKTSTILTQQNIDLAFKKPYRRTHLVGRYKDLKIVFLSPKYSQNYAVINNKYPISSINRSIVEMIINIQYFRNSLELINTFTPLKPKLDISEIFNIVNEFDLIYPYFQCVGFYLEKIGFKKNELTQFKDKVTSLIFYTDKGQNNYKFDKYWNMYYI